MEMLESAHQVTHTHTHTHTHMHAHVYTKTYTLSDVVLIEVPSKKSVKDN